MRHALAAIEAPIFLGSPVAVMALFLKSRLSPFRQEHAPGRLECGRAASKLAAVPFLHSPCSDPAALRCQTPEIGWPDCHRLADHPGLRDLRAIHGAGFAAAPSDDCDYAGEGDFMKKAAVALRRSRGKRVTSSSRDASRRFPAGADKCQKRWSKSFKCTSGIRTVARLKISGSIGKGWRSSSGPTH